MPYGAIGEAPRTRGGRRDGLSFWASDVTLDGSNPTPVVTPFTTVKFAVAQLKKTAANAFGAANVSNINVDYGGAVAAGVINLYAFNVLSAADPGEVASTNSTVVVSVFAVGIY
jgi:hypothetical protein